MFTGPLFGVFVLAMFSKRATAPGALVAGFVGFVIGSILVFAKKWGFDSMAVGVLWPAAISFFITLILGYGLSLVVGKNSEGALEYTWRKVMKNYKLQEEETEAA
jgi:Na+/proline symporter